MWFSIIYEEPKRNVDTSDGIIYEESKRNIDTIDGVV